METVHFRFYSHKPRLRVYFDLQLHTVPVVGDYIIVRSIHISEVSKNLENRFSVLNYGLLFVVVKRTKAMTSFYQEDWRIELQPVEPLKDIENKIVTLVK